jgi:hypothetical protein
LCPEGAVTRDTPALFARMRPLMQRIEPQSANKVIRTAFLRQSGIQFPNGHFFEDMFFHTNILSAAQSVAFCFAPCFTYFRRYMRQQITTTAGDRRFDAIAVTKLTLESFARTAELHDAPTRVAVLMSCLKIVAWCETAIGHQHRWAFHQTVRAMLQGIDPLYLSIPATLPAEVGPISLHKNYLESMIHAA